MVGPIGLPIDILTLEKIDAKGVDIVHTKSAMLAQIFSQTEDFNGRVLNWHVVNQQNNTISAMTGFDTVAINPQQLATQASLYHTNIVGTVSLAFDQMAINATDAGKVDYVKAMSEQAWNSLGENLGRQLYSDGTQSIAGLKDMVGFQAAVNNVTGDNLDTAGAGVAVTRPGIATYAGISRVSNPGWASVVRHCNGPITRNKFSTMLALTVKQSKGTRPNTAVCGPLTWVLLSALTIATQRNDTNPNDKRPMLSIGARAIMIDGITVVEDNLCPEGLVYFLTAENIKFATITPYACKSIGSLSNTTTEENTLNEDKLSGFWRSEEVKPLNQLAMGFQIGASGNFKIKNPAAHAVLTNVLS